VATADAQVVLQATGIDKSFGGVHALDQVDFTLRFREVHGLLGQNGAGKSTLVKVVNGVHEPDAGTIEINGKPVKLSSTMDAKNAGIAMVFQEFSLIPTLNVAQNVFLNAEPRRAGGLIDDGAAVRRTRDILEHLGVDIDPGANVGSLPVGSQQLVEIAKAMSRKPSILILDEPTASLSQAEVATLFKTLDVLRAEGVAIVYISHHLQEVLDVCDTVTVLRDGKLRLTIYNLSGRKENKPPARINIPYNNGLEVLVPAGSFEANFLRALTLLWIRLAMIAAIGIAANTFLSGPVTGHN
jgi:ribose transport system ATP-binding protein